MRLNIPDILDSVIVVKFRRQINAAVAAPGAVAPIAHQETDPRDTEQRPTDRLRELRTTMRGVDPSDVGEVERDLEKVQADRARLLDRRAEVTNAYGAAIAPVARVRDFLRNVLPSNVPRHAATPPRVPRRFVQLIACWS